MSRWRAVLVRTGALSLGLLAGLAAAEGLLRVADQDETFGSVYEKPHSRRRQESFTPDPDIGLRPVFGWKYTETGTLRNGYVFAKPPGIERVLFLGDSVTRRGRIVRALAAIYGDQRFEYWNAGVESFNTEQEVRYYKKFCRILRPDHIILTMHNNDFGATPIAFTNAEGELMVYAPATGGREANRFLFQHSRLYRLLLGARLKGVRSDAASSQETVRSALLELARVAEEDGSRLTVLVFPVVRDVERWTPGQREHHEAALRILDELGIRHFDLLEPLTDAIASGIAAERLQEGARAGRAARRARSEFHPSDELAVIIASYLGERGLLQGARSGSAVRPASP